MPTVLDNTNPIKRKQRVIANTDLPGVPEGTLGKIRVANGFSWYRYWVDFDNGVKLGHVDHGDLVLEANWEQFLIEREKAESSIDEQLNNADEATSQTGNGQETNSNSFGVPEYLLERSREARARLEA
tara:strand:- start:281 stop:664 length:384 start_codon:yes stop_codon:yes gene_type:complete